MLLQMNAGAQGRPKPAATTAIQERIDTLNEHYINSLSTFVAKQEK